jgi:hypothetical protein
LSELRFSCGLDMIPGSGWRNSDVREEVWKPPPVVDRGDNCFNVVNVVWSRRKHERDMRRLEQPD